MDMYKGLVVVITGASSGIGRATAQAFARRGAALVLAARREDMLEDARRECEALGAQALAVPTDVTREDQVERLAQAALERFGRIDVWFNNAGVGIFGRFKDLPSEAWEQVIHTNVFGTMYGAKQAMRHFRERGQGLLVNNSSIVGILSKADSTAYATSKFAIRGFSEALRQEVLDQPGIHICTVMPSVIDTPFFQHAGNFSHLTVRAAPPVYPPEKVAETVVSLVAEPKPEVVVGGFGKVATTLKPLLPAGLGTWLNGRLLNLGFLKRKPHELTPGALFEPMRDGHAVTGGWRKGFNNGGVPSMVMLGVGGLLLWTVALRRLRRDY